MTSIRFHPELKTLDNKALYIKDRKEVTEGSTIQETGGDYVVYNESFSDAKHFAIRFIVLLSFL